MQKRIREGKRPQYMLFTYGKLHSVTNTKFSMPTGHITFTATRMRKSMVVVTLAADDLKIITHLYASLSPSLLFPFLSLPFSGLLLVLWRHILSHFRL